MLRTADFDYGLPTELIAQEPFSPRDRCRLLVLDRHASKIEDRIFSDIIDYLDPGDLLVANETRVIPARLLGTKRGSGGASEVFLLREHASSVRASNREAIWEVLVKPGKRLKPESSPIVDFTDATGKVVLSAEIIDWSDTSQKGGRLARLTTDSSSLDEALHKVGKTPLPPYIRGYTGDAELYQTVYSKREGSAAAPTAGLHFTDGLIDKCIRKGIDWNTVELEVGIDTFRIVEEEDALEHKMHTEFYSIPEATAKAIDECKERGGRVIAVGTTTVRSLESSAQQASMDHSGSIVTPIDRMPTSLFIYPGYKFKVVDAMITNFHVPRSTLLMLVAAFAGYENLITAYEHAIDANYRFLSFGDAMFIE